MSMLLLSWSAIVDESFLKGVCHGQEGLDGDTHL